MIKELIDRIINMNQDTDGITKDEFYLPIASHNLAIEKILEILESYKVYDELIDRISSWWDEMYPADIFPVESEEKDRDIGAVKVAEIRELLYKVKMLSERGRSS